MGGDDGEGGDGDDNDKTPQGNENNGRWTRQEHNLFLEGIEKYGKVILCSQIPHLFCFIHGIVSHQQAPTF
jgi:hypothetical protein